MVEDRYVFAWQLEKFVNRRILPDNSKTLPDNCRNLPDNCKFLPDNCKNLPDILFVKLCGIIYAWLLKRLNFLFNILSLSLHLKFRESLTSLSGTFKAKYKGIYQFSVTLLCGARSDLHFELVRGTPGFGTKVLAVGKVKNRDMHHTNQVTVTVFAELSPNDTVKVKTKAGFLLHPWRKVLTPSLNFKLTGHTLVHNSRVSGQNF